jgi:uncharacterized protein (DUF983 family)
VKVPRYEPPAAWRFIRRALALRCPECGVSPVFVPWRKVRSLFDWFTPLDGCPRCGYAYEREQGYFLLSIWGLNYGLVGGIFLLVALWIQHRYNPGVWSAWWLVLLPMPVLSFLFARHAKSLFLAMDHYFDPHVKPPSARARDDDDAADERDLDWPVDDDEDGREHLSGS